MTNTPAPTTSAPASPARRLARVLLPVAAGTALAFPLAAALLRAQPAAAPAGGPAAAPAAATGPASRPGPDSVILTVGDEKVTVREFDVFLEALNPQDAEAARGPHRRVWAESYANMKLLAREAQRRKLEQAPETQVRLATVRDQVLANAMVVSVQDTIDPAVLRKYFDEHRAEFEKVAARHILIRFKGSAVPQRPGTPDMTEAEAKAKADQLLARVKGGEDFGRLARAESDDVGSGEDGGDLGSFTRKKMVAPFAEAAFALKENEIGGPVRTQFGYHLIQVTGRFDTYEKLIDAIRLELAPVARNQLVRDFIQGLRGKTPVTMNEAVVGPPTPMMDAPGAGPAGGGGDAATKPAAPPR